MQGKADYEQLNSYYKKGGSSLRNLNGKYYQDYMHNSPPLTTKGEVRPSQRKETTLIEIAIPILCICSFGAGMLWGFGFGLRTANNLIKKGTKQCS